LGEGLLEADRVKLFGENAARFYRIQTENT